MCVSVHCVCVYSQQAWPFPFSRAFVLSGFSPDGVGDYSRQSERQEGQEKGGRRNLWASPVGLQAQVCLWSPSEGPQLPLSLQCHIICVSGPDLLISHILSPLEPASLDLLGGHRAGPLQAFCTDW